MASSFVEVGIFVSVIMSHALSRNTLRGKEKRRGRKRKLFLDCILTEMFELLLYYCTTM